MPGRERRGGTVSAWVFKSGRWAGCPVEAVPCTPLLIMVQADDLHPPLRALIHEELLARPPGRRCCERRGSRWCNGGSGARAAERADVRAERREWVKDHSE
jgi:hypothetical protein